MAMYAQLNINLKFQVCIKDYYIRTYVPVKQRSCDIHISILSLDLNDNSREYKGKAIANTFGLENLEMCSTLIMSFNCMVTLDNAVISPLLGQYLITGMSYSNKYTSIFIHF